jgi:hypothetical protein
MEKGVKGIGVRNTLTRDAIKPKFAGRHIMQVNSLAKCSPKLYAQDLILVKMLNGPSP